MSWLHPTAQYGQMLSTSVAPRVRGPLATELGLKGWRRRVRSRSAVSILVAIVPNLASRQTPAVDGNAHSRVKRPIPNLSTPVAARIGTVKPPDGLSVRLSG